MTLLQTLIGSMVNQPPPQAFWVDQLPESAQVSRTARLIYQIGQSPGISTSALGHWIGEPTRIVWGLLKHARSIGRVEHTAAGGWRISTAQEDQQTADAVALLQARGWQCVPPTSKGAA